MPMYKIYHMLKGGDVTERNSLWFIKLTLLAPFALLLFWLMLAYVYEISKDKEFSIALAFFTIFATPLVTYFSTLFSHSLTAVLLFLFFMLIRKLDENSSKFMFVFTGLVGGTAFINEYQTAIALSVMSVWFLFRLKKKSSYLYFLFGVIVMASLFFTYNVTVFGSMFSVGVSNAANSSFKIMHSKGLYGITIPNANSIMNILFSMAIGIFPLSPFFLYMFPGIIKGFITKKAETVVAFLIVIIQLYIVTSLSNWQGGWGFGGRYMTPAIPFIMILVAQGVHFSKKSKLSMVLFSAMAIFSTFSFSLAHALRPLTAPVYKNPISNYFFTSVREQYMPYESFVTLLGFSRVNSFYIYIAMLFIVSSLVIWWFLKKYQDQTFMTIISIVIAFSMVVVYMIPNYGRKDELFRAYDYMNKKEFNKDIPLDRDTSIKESFYKKKYEKTLKKLGIKNEN